ncbi:MAG TPA: single-stranded-DNA-specific exonuclease RecJ [Pyrinomonadaceae bacterium]|nr:single-stranded-DNA-specific exonuclease RecJ [Pyrinomonadaceae bacterium]
MQKKWNIRKHDADAVNRLADELGVVPIVAALLISRGHDTVEKAQAFLNPSPEHLHDPYLLTDMDKAVARIQQAVATCEKIMIWGDYDVDGTTGTVLLRRTLRLLGSDCTFHIPNRFSEGYGINIPALDEAKNNGVSLVISVDCGTTSVAEVAHANSIGLDVIITDHHLPKTGSELPPAVAIVNPNQPDDNYPEKTLAGVGVAFKLAHALLREAGREEEITQFLQIAALGTVADIMDLTGENRAIVALGLIDLAKTDNWGLKALMEVSDCRSDMTSMHIGFRLGPRINAAGRMDVAMHVVELFEAVDFATARKLAALLDSRNRERQKIQQEITELALFETESHDGKHFIVVAGESWHKGVIGLAASRIADKLYRPTIVLSIDDEDIAHGSARSIPGFHLLEALESAPELMHRFGGHAAAAGMAMPRENIEELRERLNRLAADKLTDDDLIPTLDIDALITPETLSLGLVESLAAFEPFGKGNPKPIFVTRGLKLLDDPFVMKEKHLKLKLGAQNGRTFEAVWWDGVAKSSGQTLREGTGIELAYVAEANKWNGNTRLQLVVEDLRADN